MSVQAPAHTETLRTSRSSIRPEHTDRDYLLHLHLHLHLLECFVEIFKFVVSSSSSLILATRRPHHLQGTVDTHLLIVVLQALVDRDINLVCSYPLEHLYSKYQSIGLLRQPARWKVARFVIVSGQQLFRVVRTTSEPRCDELVIRSSLPCHVLI